MAITSEEIGRGIQTIKAIADAIKDAGEIPAGTLYAVLCDRMELGSFNKIVSILVNGGLVSNNNHLLKWIA